MLTIKRVEPSATCVFCNKTRECAAVILDGQQEVLLCWSDIKKHAQMRMRMNGEPAGKPLATVTKPAAGAEAK
jgi:hypothetical protein